MTAPCAFHQKQGRFDPFCRNYQPITDDQRRIKELEAEHDRLTQWVHDLQANMWINCIYCGHRYGPAESTPPTMQQVLKDHIEQCPKHPMSALKAELAEAVGLMVERSFCLGRLETLARAVEPVLRRYLGTNDDRDAWDKLIALAAALPKEERDVL